TIATVWHYAGKPGKLRLDTDEVAVYDIHGDCLLEENMGGSTEVPVSHRRLLLHFPGTSASTVRQVLSGASLEMRKPKVIWRQAEDFDERVGSMVRGATAQVEAPEAFGDVVLCAGRFDRSGQTPCYCQYTVQVPHPGRWWLWARVRYPTGGDMSFGLVRPGEQVTLSGKQVLGNCGVNEKKWHWTGRGGGVTTEPPGSPIVFDLEAGDFTVRIYPREGPGTTAGNPRLDCFCLVDDPDYRPTNADAKAAFQGE
ncbi:MAG: hypothetical protein R6U98_14335, partial [Pirellulaceae bacterium]